MTLEDSLTPLAMTLAAIQDQIATWQDEEKSIRVQIRELTAETGPDTYAAGGLKITVSANNRFDPKLALSLVSEALAVQVVDNIPTVNKDRLRVLAPHIFAQAQTRGDYRVSLR